MTGAELEIIGDLLDMWGYMPIKIEAAESISALNLIESSSLIMFQFLEFSEAEYKWLRTLQESLPNVPIVATSPFISVRDIFRIVRSGIADYLVQPYMPTDLKQIIEKYLGAPFSGLGKNHGPQKLEMARP
jgi:DNA-binding NtrC family response regulator